MENINNTFTSETPIQSIKTPITSEPIPTPSKSNLFKYLFIISIVVLLIVIISFIFILNNKNSKQSPIEQKTNDISEATPTTVIPNEEVVKEVTPTITKPIEKVTAPNQDWKSYEEKEWGLYFLYPKQWKITKLNAGLSDYKPENRQFLSFLTSDLSQDHDGRLDVYPNETISSITTNSPYITSNYNKIIKTEKILRNYNKEWTKLTIERSNSEGKVYNTNYIYLIEKNNKVYELTGIDDYSEQILNTLEIN